MKASSLFEIYERDLTALRKEIESYDREGDLWRIDKQISNSAGNLCLHIIGNLNHFIGNVLGKSGYIRNREVEFSIKNVPAKELDLMIEKTIVMLKGVFDKLNENDLIKEFPLEIMGKRASTEFWLIHFAGHINYHLGQINYHRRLL
jgi:hypothetical protein